MPPKNELDNRPFIYVIKDLDQGEYLTYGIKPSGNFVFWAKLLSGHDYTDSHIWGLSPLAYFARKWQSAERCRKVIKTLPDNSCGYEIRKIVWHGLRTKHVSFECR